MEDVFPNENGDIPASYVSLPARTRYSQNSPILDNSCEFPFHGLSSQLCHAGIRTKKTTTTQQLALRHQSLYIPQALIDVTCGLSNARVAGAPPSRMANSHPRTVPWGDGWGCRIGG